MPKEVTAEVVEANGAEPQAIQRYGEVSVEPTMTLEKAKERFGQLQEFVKFYLKDGEDYGTIPGTPKPTLFKSGADKLCDIYGLSDSYRVLSQTLDWDRGLFDYEIECLLTSRRTSLPIRTGLGSCSSFEGRYLYQNAKLVCPACGKATVIKGKAEYGGGWICWKKAGKSDGCGAKFKEGDAAITQQPIGKVRHEPEELADIKNTVLKMARKRALIDATIAATRSSGLFTQDIGDNKPDEEPAEERAKDSEIAKRHGVTAPVGTKAAADQVRDAKLEKLRQATPPGGVHVGFAGEPAQPDLLPALEKSNAVEQLAKGLARTLCQVPPNSERWVQAQDELVRLRGWKSSEVPDRIAEAMEKAQKDLDAIAQGKITAAQLQAFWTVVHRHKWGKDRAHAELLDKFEIASATQIPAAKYEDVIIFFDREPPEV